jgi:putative selenate reductase
MSDKFSPIPVRQLLQIILNEYDRKKSIFGIDEALFFNPFQEKRFQSTAFNQTIGTPLGVAAGPHSQMAQNIVAAWLMGSRYIELKTIQTLDELEVSKPCIDMQDEGYNCEWSQELKIKESFNEYLNAWIIIHLLNHKLGWGASPETIFNMSVGYNLEGILQENVQWFFKKMMNCSVELKEKIEEIKPVYPEIEQLDIPAQISNNITLSTMHGCPANEIEDIAKYLLREKHLHTFVKLNPTLLGPEQLRKILNEDLNFDTHVPDLAFEHDLKYPDALKIIRSLLKTAREEKLQFGLKLTNTLESINHKNIFKPENEMMYMSGRALHPISINVAKKLQTDFNGQLKLSFSGGVNAFNVADALACGFETLTVSSDLLKPGGYTRMNQYFKELGQAFEREDVDNIEAYILRMAGKQGLMEAAFCNLKTYANRVLESNLYKRSYLRTPDIKTKKPLGFFDCISAPCEDTCPTNQGIPSYMYHTSRGEFEEAYKVITKTNPFPNSTGMVCDHVCQTKCTRMNYDEPLAIRDIKRFVVEWHNNHHQKSDIRVEKSNDKRVSIIGAGPTGLSCAYFLRQAGFEVDVYEAKQRAGGMVSWVIPKFRITDENVDLDVETIEKLGVNIHYNHKINQEDFEKLRSKSDYVVIAAGAQEIPQLMIEGIEAEGVMQPLAFLAAAKSGNIHHFGSQVAVIGGGNTAMDIARTAYRLVGKSGKVSVVYRRSINEMPAVYQEIMDAMTEGVEFVEWTAPVKVNKQGGKVSSLTCIKMKAGEKDDSGRARPVPIEGSEFDLAVDTVIPAIGQKLAFHFVDEKMLQTKKNSFETRIKNVFIGGDAKHGAATLITGVGDGRKIAQEIIDRMGIDFDTRHFDTSEITRKPGNLSALMQKKSQRVFGEHPKEIPLNDRQNFNIVTETFSEQQAKNEASRCLLCDEVCNICTTVCPNLANYSYNIEPVSYHLQKIKITDGKTLLEEDGIFEVKQKIQILNIDNFCNECGNCGTFCPTQSAPYKEKPQIFLTKSSFAEAEEGYYLEKQETGLRLLGKKSGENYSLYADNEAFIFENRWGKVYLNKADFSITDMDILTNIPTEISLREAARMSVILEGVRHLEFL